MIVVASLTGFAIASSSDRSISEMGQTNVTADTMDNIDWSVSYSTEQSGSGWAVIQTSDGGFAIAGDQHANVMNSSSEVNTTIIKTTPDGTREWTKTVDRGHVDNALDIVETRDGGFVSVGIDSTIKLDRSGNVVWAQNIQDTQLPLDQDLVFEETNGDLFIIGTTCCDDRQTVFVRTDSTGKVIWNREVSITNNANSYLDIAADHISGGFVVGVTGETTDTAYLYAISNSGEFQWKRQYDNINIHDVKTLSNGDILVTGTDTSQNTLWLSRVNQSDDRLWNRTYPLSEPISTGVAPNGNISVLTKEAILTVTGDGEPLTVREVQTPSGVTIRGAVQTNPNEFVITGAQETDQPAKQIFLAHVSGGERLKLSSVSPDSRSDDDPSVNGTKVANQSVQTQVDNSEATGNMDGRTGSWLVAFDQFADEPTVPLGTLCLLGLLGFSVHRWLNNEKRD